MKIEIDVPNEHINGALLEPHSRYWASEAIWDPTHQVGRVVEREGANGQPDTHTLYPSKLKTALEFMARRYPVPFSRLQAGTYDGTTGDLLLQLMAFGPTEAKYG